jgi:hypothetical protein
MFKHDGILYHSDSGGRVCASKGDVNLSGMDQATEHAVRQADKERGVAMGYAWGAMNNGATVTSEQVDDFANAYAGHAFDYYRPDSGVGTKTNIKDALAHFLAGRGVDGGERTPLVRPAAWLSLATQERVG